MRSRMLKLFPLLVVSLAAACVYRQDIPQGNFFKAEDAAMLEEGMTREQVRYVMGTPMITDPFHPDRWDYVFLVNSQEEERDFHQRVTVFFAGDTVSRIETEGLDEQDVPRGDEGILLEDEVLPRDEEQNPLELDDPVRGNQ